jgi:hypothetical protein
MNTGKPFKTRSIAGRIDPSVLNTPDVLKYHIPLPFAFVPVDPLNTVNKHSGKFPEAPKKQRPYLESSGQYSLTNECQRQVINLNRCLKNVGLDDCQYYRDYLNNLCRK